MLRGYWGVILAIVGLVAIGGGVSFGLLQQYRYKQEAEHRHTDYARHAADQIRQNCASIVATQQAQCLTNAVDGYILKARDNQREFDNLVAQRTSALWSGIMGGTALLGMFLSALGVVLVRNTFQETKRTNLIALKENARTTRRAVASGRETKVALEIAAKNAEAAEKQIRVAQDTAKRQLRAYISVETVALAEPMEAGKSLKLMLRLRNFGTTPAHSAQVITGGGWVPANPGEEMMSVENADWSLASMATIGPTAPMDQMIETDLVTPQIFSAIMGGQFEAFFVGEARYDDIFGVKQKTRFRYQLDTRYGARMVAPTKKGNSAT